jgi:hypothetical protein
MFFFLQAESIRLLHKQCQLSGDIIIIAHRDADPSTGKGFVWVFASRWMLQRLLERGPNRDDGWHGLHQQHGGETMHETLARPQLHTYSKLSVVIC